MDHFLAFLMIFCPLQMKRMLASLAMLNETFSHDIATLCSVYLLTIKETHGNKKGFVYYWCLNHTFS